MLIVRHHEVRDLLEGRELQVVDAVRTAYRLHDEGRTVVPHSIFLRLPATADEPDTRNRIIGLPAHISTNLWFCMSGADHLNAKPHFVHFCQTLAPYRNIRAGGWRSKWCALEQRLRLRHIHMPVHISS